MHRDQPGTPGWLRRDMIAAALAGRPDLCLDDRELRREGPSYTVETLRSLAAELPAARLCLLVGDDAFAGFPDWRAPDEILGLANIAVLERPGHAAMATPGAAELMQRHGVARLDPARTGQIVTCPVTQLAISASDIRARVASGASCPHWSSITGPAPAVCDRISDPATERPALSQRLNAPPPRALRNKGLVITLTHHHGSILFRACRARSTKTGDPHGGSSHTLEDMKAFDIETLDVRGKTSITDFFVLASGTSDRHVKSAAEAVAFQAKQAGQVPIGTEGLQEGEWALIDLNGVVVHVMQAKVRDFYQLERLWNMDPRRNQQGTWGSGKAQTQQDRERGASPSRPDAQLTADARPLALLRQADAHEYHLTGRRRQDAGVGAGRVRRIRQANAGRVPPAPGRDRRGKRGKNADIARILRDETERLLAAVPRGAAVVALEVGGRRWSTEQLSQRLDEWMNSGQDVALLVGGPDGLGTPHAPRPASSWSLSPLTLPHPLVRVILAEQLYRAWSILRNHPYHRA